jgi:asparagine synthase (glutamine-hydrolysing)
VALAGEGGDELFAGYPTYQAHALANCYKMIPSILRKKFIEKIIRHLPVSMKNFSFDYRAKKFISGIPYPYHIRNAIWLGAFMPGEKAELYSREMKQKLTNRNAFNAILNYFEKVRKIENLTAIQYLDMKTYLQDDLLVKVDRVSMANSLEVRVPYLDHRLVEFIYSLPPDFKLNHLQTKYILKRCMKGTLPAKVIRRKKKGFGMPVAFWCQNELKDFLLDVFSKDKIVREGFFNFPYINELLHQHFTSRKDNRKQIWSLLMFELWFREHM